MKERQKDPEMDVILVVTTFPDVEVGRQIGTQLVESQLAACVNLVPGVESIYRWKGAVEREQEVVGLIKTTQNRWEQLEGWMQEHHPYEEPELIAMSIDQGASGYLDWVRKAVSSGETGWTKRDPEA
tara:strand:+ start:5639 stop:6019 length:381 start_codon:yes stop_codon:yes gene_type:complete